jgi:hypothetical protein
MKKSGLLRMIYACFFVCGHSTLADAFSLLKSPISGQGTWETTLQARDLDGNPATIDAYYDTVLKITWLSEAGLAEAGNFRSSSLNLDWYEINDLIASININGIARWRLPTMIDTGSPGCDWSYGGTDCGYNVQTTSGSTVYSEMASLYYDTLGNLALYDTSGNPQAGGGLKNTGPFSIWTTAGYWTGLDYALNIDNAWLFDLPGGAQDGRLVDKRSGVPYAWPVHDGDVGTAIVPLPAAVCLFGSGLVGLAGISRRKKSAYTQRHK